MAPFLNEVYTNTKLNLTIEVFFFGGSEIKGIDSILDSDSIIDIDKKLNLSKILKKLISKINPRKLFGKSDLLKEGDLRQVMLDGGTEELLKESLANMLEERIGFKGYKLPKKDNISISTI